MYLVVVDCENCSIESIEKQLKTLIESDIILIVGALQSEYKYKKLSKKAKTIKCNTVSKNAADFVLVAASAYKMCTKKYSKLIIVSNDGGFDSAIKYFNSNGLKSARISPEKLIIPKGTLSFCGYLANNFNSGVSYDRLVRKSKKEFKYRVGKIINTLEDMGVVKIVKVKTRQVYFSKKKLKRIARS